MYTLYAKYRGHDWEEVADFYSMKDAADTMREYQMKYSSGYMWKVVKR